MKTKGALDDLRPRGAVSVSCAYPGCNIGYWVDALDPRLPDGPFYCGGTHEDDRQKAIESLWPIFGLQWGSRQYQGPRSDGLQEAGCGYGGQKAGFVLFHDKWWSRRVGQFNYDDIRTLDDPFSIPARINWEAPPEEKGFPHLGGKVYLEGPTGLKPMQLVLHKCSDCGSVCYIYETHKRAFSGPASCADDPCHSKTPCPVRDKKALAFDRLLQELHGPAVEWTMWEGLNHQTANTVERFDRGLVLVRKLAGRTAFFDLIAYDHPDELSERASKVRWQELRRIVLPANTPWEMSSRIERAVAFLGISSD